jgi:hypothetical protein
LAQLFSAQQGPELQRGNGVGENISKEYSQTIVYLLPGAIQPKEVGTYLKGNKRSFRI